jgi:hypothetical protein
MSPIATNSVHLSKRKGTAFLKSLEDAGGSGENRLKVLLNEDRLNLE